MIFVKKFNLTLILSFVYLGLQPINSVNFQLSQPQIYIEDGHMYIMPAEHRNLVLSANGVGKIMLNNHELNNLVSSVQNSTRDLEGFKRAFGVPSNSSDGFAGRITHLEQSMNRLGQLEALDSRLTTLERQMTYPAGANTTTDGTGASESSSGGSSSTPPRLARQLRRLTTRVRNLEQKISSNRNPCRSNPCSNGGTCLPTAFGAFCFCPIGWEGERCEVDVNECSEFTGTDLGCQNRGNCINTPGSYHCQCQAGWFGIHCSIRSGDCSSGSSYELCGHGTCVNQHVGSRPFSCICDQGWKTDGVNPSCSVDVDECNSPHPSCSQNPPVSCINTPGSFHCGPCPYGYTGNGYHCTDVNECLQNNGGCSTNPMVQCINTIGSRNCGECPPGYIGNGVACQFIGICQVNNGGCYPLARCVENPMIGQSFVQCVCPAGYTGTGMGLHGCFPYSSGGGGGGGSGTDVGPSINPCSNNPCTNGGACTSYGNTFACNCLPGFTGQTCAVRLDPCLSLPCQNGGTCRQLQGSTYVCHCANDFTGANCERQEESCGGRLQGVEGTLSYPHDSSQTYSHNTNCMWILRTTPGKVLNVTFTRFHLEFSSNRCDYDWLEIHDGRDTTDRLIGKYCGEQLPNDGNIISTHEILFFWFRSDHSTTGLGFEFNWNTTDPICGGEINGTHGAISSPGYPGDYPHNRDCLWTITVGLSKRIQLVFATLQIEVHSNCSFDYLEVRDGLEESAFVLGKFCNTTLPPPVISSGPHLTLRFHTDDTATDKGFHVTFTEIPGVPECGGTFTESQGSFTSPQHPEPYAHGLDCEYLIRLPSADERILLTFLSFELESGSNCRFDFVEIRDGNRPDSPLLGRFCERNMPPIIRSSTNSLYVLFRSDASVSFGGFSAKYESVCGGIFASPEGILRSPFHPAAYPKNRNCIYIISQPVGKAISLSFLNFDIESTGDSRCYYDYLEIRDGDNENSTLVGHYCGGPQAMPDPVISTYNYLWIRFKTDGSVQNKGFMANYSTIDTGCGGILKQQHGVISSPGHPEIYPHGVRCKWVIRGEPGQVIRLSWVTFSLERNLRCRYDAVEIYDNSTLVQNNSLIGRYCGQELPPLITSSDYTMTITFESDHSVAHDGFMANYIIVNASTVCGANYFTQYGVIRSPNYPNNYPHGKSCTWTIQVPTGKQIMLNITDFEMENGTQTGCIYDYLEIRNGAHVTSPLVGKFCGNNLPPATIPSFSNSLLLKFSTDSSRSAKGFNIYWDGTTTGCGGVLNSPSGSIVSPNYPVGSTARTECFWTISVNKGSAIQFTFVDLDLQRSPDCRREYVEVRDGSSPDSTVLGKYCTTESILAINSSGNALRIKFLNTFGSNGRGFHASYQTICTRTLRGFSGVIESPNWPKPYPHHRNCTWRIEAPLGNKLNLSFSHFSVEEPYRNNCRYDFVEITESDVQGTNRRSIGKSCGTDMPSMISTNLQVALVNFVTDATKALNGFRMEWVINGCGGRIAGQYGILKSPNYPRPYNLNVMCEWEITTTLGTRVQLDIYDLDLEKADQCGYDYLKIFGGPDDNSPLLLQLCHKTDKRVSVMSHGNRMFVRFYSDGYVTAKGFYGWISEREGGCGGYLNAPTGFIYSPNYPRAYDSDDDCEWVIDVDENHVVELSFLEFDVERHINCSYDHVAVYDGRSSNAPLLIMACGNTLPDPPVVKSTGNIMYVRFKTDGSNVGRGFKLNYTTGCGAKIIAEYRGELTSPNFPHMIHKLNCSWFIMGPTAEDRVSLTLTHMDIRSRNDENENCERNYVEVLDGEDLDAPSIGKYCWTRIPPTIISQGNGLVVRVVTTNDAHGFGFRATYDVASSACGGILTSLEGAFSTPNYPNGYPPNAECTWSIQASAGNRVALSFRFFDIESSDFCNSDYVEIHENDASGQLLGHFCGSEIPTNITAERKLWVLFRTDADGQAPGFIADYTLVHGNELSSSFGGIESPLYPLPMHMPGTFTWRVMVNESQAIQITFFEFDVGYSQDPHNRITIYDGYDDTAPTILSEGGQTMPEPITSTGNVVYIVFAKKYSQASIFSLQWQEVPVPGLNITALSSNITGCGGNVSILEGNVSSLISPGYPSSYPLNMRCEWILNSLSNHRIQLKIEDIDMESHQTCQYDKLEIYDGVNGLPNYELNKTICSRTENGTVLTSTGRTLKLVFTTDFSVSGPGFNISLSSVCGGIIRDSRGRITTPNYPRNYSPSQCTWTIIVRPGRTIQLTFEAFNIYTGADQTCATDQLIIRNGGNNDSPFLGQGRYCGSTSPVIPESSGNQLFLRFSSYTSGGTGFALIYNEISAGCGGQIHLTNDAPDFIFSSPNYPHIPPPFTECEWIFTVPQNEAVQLEFLLTFEFTRSWPCDHEGIELRDGGTRLSPLINTFCREMPGTQKSTGNILYVRYFTNFNEPKPGFKAKASIAKCGGTLVGWSGTILSPGHPNNYDINTDCEWTIRGPEAAYLTLEFLELQIGSNANIESVTTLENCTQDWIQISESNITEIENPRNWSFCGLSSIPRRIETSMNKVHIFFHSGSVRNTQGKFKLQYRSSTERCGGSMTSPTGVIQSINYPRPYPHYRGCYWRITAPQNRRIRFEFLDFDLEESVTGLNNVQFCPDQVSVTAGYYSSIRLYNKTLCGSSLPPPVESTSNMLSVSFRTDGSVTHRGFKARYMTDLPAICGGDLTGATGNVSSPEDQTGTPNTTTSIQCEWSHSGSTFNTTTIVTIKELKLPPWSTTKNLYCSQGTLRIRPGEGSSLASYNWRQYCGVLANEKVYIPGDSFRITYEALHWESGFNVSYQVHSCGGILNGPNNTIQSPNYPSSYPVSTECIWILQYYGGSQISITFTTLDMDDHQSDVGCDRDFVVVRNGQFPSSPELGKYCGSNMPATFNSMSNLLWIEFHSDENSDGSRRGFQIETTLIDHGCGGVLHNKRGSIRSPKADSSSPRYTIGRYPNNIECEWIIETVPGYTINIMFDVRFDIEISANCSNDYLEFFTKTKYEWTSVGRYCGKQLPRPLNTTSTSVKVKFHTNQDINGDGFVLNWYSPCGGIFTDDEGIVRSAHYDRLNHSVHISGGNYNYWSWMGWESTFGVAKCDYVIQGSSDNDYIVTEFMPPFEVTVPELYFYQPEPEQLTTTCPYVNLTIWEGNASVSRWNTHQGGLFCGQEVPPVFVGRGAVTISYNYKPSFENYGWKVRYTIYQCGGEISEPKSIQSPGHPFTSAPNMNCTWFVHAPAGKVVRFKFEWLELEFSPRCRYDYVNLYDGNRLDDSKKLGTFCGNLTSNLARISSKTNTMVVQFVTDWSVHLGGFKGTVDFTIGEEQGCGGRINTTAGPQSLQSPDADNDGKYDQFLDCQWLVVGPDFQIIELSFTSFVLEGQRRPRTVTGAPSTDSIDTCPYDYLEIRDGPGPYGSLLGKFCGSTIPPRIISSTNFMWINFVTDGAYQYAGFRSTLTSRPSPCGTSFVLNATSAPQTLTSLNYPANYENNIRCKWTVDGARFNDEVDIRFIELQVESSPGCNKDRIEIRDLSSSYNNPDGIGGPILFNGNRAVDWRFRNLDINTETLMQNFAYCGSQTPPDFFSIGRSAEIVFITDSTNTASGFKLEYKAAGCNRTFENSHGRIFSPEYPTYSPIYTNCVIMIRAVNGSTISLYFNTFQLADSVDCSTQGFFEVRETSADGTLLGKYCGSSRPNPIFSSTNVLWINFVTRFLLTRGFDISYTTTSAGSGCGGDLFHTSGSFTSPFYPGNYSQNSDCRWKIRVPAGLKIKLTFTSFMIGSGDCSLDFLELFSMNSHDATAQPVLFTRFCPSDSPSIYNGETDMAMVRYKSSANNTGMGWRIEFQGVLPT